LEHPILAASREFVITKATSAVPNVYSSGAISSAVMLHVLGIAAIVLHSLLPCSSSSCPAGLLFPFLLFQ
jgi:hypothetical protein